MGFHHKQNKCNTFPNITINGNDIKYVTVTKFLGLWIDETLNWNSNIRNLTTKLSKIRYAIKKIKHSVTQDICRILYLAYYYALSTIVKIWYYILGKYNKN